MQSKTLTSTKKIINLEILFDTQAQLGIHPLLIFH